jgi:hypothetical protein
MKRECLHVPENLWPLDEDFVKYNCVFRLIRHPDRIIPQDFFPSHANDDGSLNSKKLGGIRIDKGTYSVSLNIELRNLDNHAKRLIFKGVARGFTNISRGISLVASSSGHVNYFLYDYIYNNPAPDFVVV